MKTTEIAGMHLSAMSMGTVQLGMNYGIANNGGKPDEEKSFAMLRTALDSGVTSLDTARVYGNAEDVLGRFFDSYKGKMPFITTKIPKIQGKNLKEIEQEIISSVETSLEHLHVPRVNCVMLRVAADLSAHGSDTAAAMKSLLKRGYADMVGASVYTADDLNIMLESDVYTATQVPMSIFDERLIQSGMTEVLRQRGIVTFVRSVFLQGLFFLDPEKITDPILLEHAAPRIRTLRELAEHEGISVPALAIAFIRDIPGITSLVLGADTPEQVLDNIRYFDTPPLSEHTRNVIQETFRDVNIPEIMKVLSRPKAQ